MRASRLLRILLLLQNRGRMTSARLAEELEVAPRTILRDVDAMTEAGLPIVVHQGNRGGIELGFNYRTRLTGLARDEAEALGIILAADSPVLAALDLDRPAARARAKLLESLPDSVRADAQRAAYRFRHEVPALPRDDPRIRAFVHAVREERVVTIGARGPAPRRVHPAALVLGQHGWAVEDALSGLTVPQSDWHDINVSAHRFTDLTQPGPPTKKAAPHYRRPRDAR